MPPRSCPPYYRTFVAVAGRVSLVPSAGDAQGENEGTGNVVGGKANPTIDHAAACPSTRPWCPALRINGLAGHVPASTMAGSQGGEPPRTRHALPTSRAGLCAVLLGEKESCVALALTFVLGRVSMRTACLPFTRGSDRGCSSRSDGRCSNRAVTRNRVGRRRELGSAIRSAVIISRVGQGWESGDVSGSRSAGNRSHRPVRSLLACVK